MPLSTSKLLASTPLRLSAKVSLVSSQTDRFRRIQMTLHKNTSPRYRRKANAAPVALASRIAVSNLQRIPWELSTPFSANRRRAVKQLEAPTSLDSCREVRCIWYTIFTLDSLGLFRHFKVCEDWLQNAECLSADNATRDGNALDEAKQSEILGKLQELEEEYDRQ
jgi:hypothetical protein